MKALTDGVSASLRQSATINQGGKFVTGRDSGDQAGPAVVLAADARLAADGA
jgi:hypothetical protein